ncbi:hypothetical protein SKAU_G00105840 [Synaphobranchus kaupii]|uniref:Uncharacterized protein n=1 Tax=Synaphobranchus kaupii TaxID=118154 RepID=A0A9Q1FZH2_SYNKA|nr:hypothetical protein SKAU_G00105840 [Synaphobranchus kaupii]
MKRKEEEEEDMNACVMERRAPSGPPYDTPPCAAPSPRTPISGSQARGSARVARGAPESTRPPAGCTFVRSDTCDHLSKGRQVRATDRAVKRASAAWHFSRCRNS